MAGKCKLTECGAPAVPCHEGCENFKDCENFISEKVASKMKREVKKEQSVSSLGWSGEALSINDIAIVSNRNSPYLIGAFGKADAGKTTYLAMVYTLLLNGGTLAKYNFSGTKTIIGWDQLHHRLKLSQGGVAFPPPTPVSANRLFHLALRGIDEKLVDVLFADASGEVFTLWGVNREDENAESARWIYANSNAFMLFIDCEALVNGKNAAKREIMQIARQLSNDLKDRPVIAVWSKADRIDEILPSIKDSLKSELSGILPKITEVEISNFLVPGPDELVHKNNLAAIDNLLDRMIVISNSDLPLTAYATTDSFVNYKGI
jgi:hypothetical protein